MQIVFAVALLLSASLLFIVEPMFAKMVLPQLGGSPSVWNTCLVFYQAALLAGYVYAHVSVKWLGVRRQAVLHLVLLTLPWLVLPLSAVHGWLPARSPESNPIPWLLLLLTVSLGLPFLCVSATAPLLQAWFAQTGRRGAKDPYFLYAASNLGSMLGLAAYPLWIESHMSLAGQRWWWAAGYGLFMALVGLCAVGLWLSRGKPEATGADEPAVSLRQKKPTFGRRLRWLALAAVPSSLLLGVTTHLSTDAPSMPLLWVLPLALYLLSFVLVFARWRILPHRWMVWTQAGLLVVLAGTLWANGNETSQIVGFAVLHLLAFFATAMVCHGELAADRPATSHLTEFYLWMSVGGVVGGLFNALVAPLIFTTVFEYPLMLVAACLCRPWRRSEKGPWARPVELGGIVVLIGLVALAAWLIPQLKNMNEAAFVTVIQTMLRWVAAIAAGGLLILAIGRNWRFKTRWRTQPGRCALLLQMIARPWNWGAAAVPGLWLQAAQFAILLFPVALVALTPWLLPKLVTPWLFPQPSDKLVSVGKEIASLWVKKETTALWLLAGLSGFSLVMLAVACLWRPRPEPEDSWSGDARSAPGKRVWVTPGELCMMVLLLALGAFICWQLPRLEGWKDKEAALAAKETTLKVMLGLTVIAQLLLVKFFLWRPQHGATPGPWAKPVGLAAMTCLIGLVVIAGWILPELNDRTLVVKVMLLALIGLTAFGLSQRPLLFATGLALLLTTGVICSDREKTIFQTRSFYGVLKVEQDADLDGVATVHRLMHGSTLHGEQSLDPDEALQAWTYYHRDGPVGDVFKQLRRRVGFVKSGRIGVVGLGTGTIASYAENKTQELTYFEIDPAVQRIAGDPQYFTYLYACLTQPQIKLGDARLTIEKEEDGHFDVLLIDAFSSDAIPIHLITREAIELFFKKLAPDGLLAMHISNRHLDLEPVLGNAAEALHYVARTRNDNDEGNGKLDSTWVVLVRRPGVFGVLDQEAGWVATKTDDELPVWTDDFSNVIGVVRWPKPDDWNWMPGWKALHPHAKTWFPRWKWLNPDTDDNEPVAVEAETADP